MQLQSSLATPENSNSNFSAHHVSATRPLSEAFASAMQQSYYGVDTLVLGDLILCNFYLFPQSDAFNWSGFSSRRYYISWKAKGL